MELRSTISGVCITFQMMASLKFATYFRYFSVPGDAFVDQVVMAIRTGIFGFEQDLLRAERR